MYMYTYFLVILVSEFFFISAFSCFAAGAICGNQVIPHQRSNIFRRSKSLTNKYLLLSASAESSTSPP